jgi:hypothetical protein
MRIWGTSDFGEYVEPMRTKKCNKKPFTWKGFQKLCGAKGIRTLDLYNAIVALSQLSYSPVQLSLFY